MEERGKDGEDWDAVAECGYVCCFMSKNNRGGKMAWAMEELLHVRGLRDTVRNMSLVQGLP